MKPIQLFVVCAPLALVGCGSDDSSGGGGAAGSAGSSSGGVAGASAGGTAGSASGGIGGGTGGSSIGGSPAGLKLILDDDLEYAAAQDTVSSGPFISVEGNPSFVTTPVHSGNKAMKLEYGSAEDQDALIFDLPGVVYGQDNGASILQLQWHEYRPSNFDFAGEKMIRLVGKLDAGYVSLDLILVFWAKQGTSGTDAPDNFTLEGNSVYTTGNQYIGVNVASKWVPDQWNKMEVFVDLGSFGKPDGSAWIKLNDALIGQANNVTMRPNMTQQGKSITRTFTIDQVWVGGWWSPFGGGNPNPSPAVRYLDGVKIWRD